MHLSPEQLVVVASPEPRKRVVAGAGSGKTAVLVAQVQAWLDEGVPPDTVSVVTFTRRAGMEVRRRLGAAGARLAHCGTIAGLAFRRLWEAGIRYVPIDDYDLRLIILHVAQEARRTDGLRPEVVARLVLHADYGTETASDRALAHLVLSYLARHRLLHVSGILPAYLSLLRTGGMLRAPSWRGTRALAWDEFQDSSRDELAILEALAPDRSLVVGDPRQSIYQWRGAVPENLDAVPGAAFDLADNWRSGSAIVARANALSAAHGYREQCPRRPDPGVVEEVPGTGPVEAVYLDLVRAHGPVMVLCRSNREIARLAAALGQVPGGPTVAVVAAAYDPYTTPAWRRLYVAARLVLDPENEWLRSAAGRLDVSGWGPHNSIEALARIVGAPTDDPHVVGESVLGWLEWYATRDLQDMLPGDEERPDVLLMTVHGAKGLEWPTVVIHGADRMARSEHPEERNIHYVATTRARDRLVLVREQPKEAGCR
jgi:superfamily I DNA/RNA helicase